MKEYIDKEAFIAEIDRRIRLSWMGKAIGETIKFHIEKQPAADVVGRKRGRWLEIDGEVFECDMCHGIRTEYKYNFCPDCGADMREVDHEN